MEGEIVEAEARGAVVRSGPRALLLGPILRFRGAEDGTARLAVTIAVPAEADPPVLRASGRPGPGPECIGTLGGAAFWSWRFEEPLDGGRAAYEISGARHEVVLARSGDALRVAYTSCNGGEDEAEAARSPGGRNAMWTQLARRHEARPLHLLLMGGDQIYADGLWELPAMRAWVRLPRRARLAAPFTEAMRAELEAHYLATYADVLGAPEVAGVLARVPGVMMWDDHDIVDGWGSRPPAWQASPVARGLFAVARRAFALVQLGCDPDAPPPSGFASPEGAHYGWEGAYGPARLVVPDLRSERTRSRVMGPAGHAALAHALDAAAEPHLVVVSSVPLVNADLSMLERVVTPLMPLADLYQDDLRDQWMSHRHAAEWRAVMERLLLAAEAGRRVTVLSGEIHLGAHGSAERPGGRAGARVEQLTASGIAHPPPPRLLARALDRLTRRPWTRRGLRLAMHPVAPDARRYVAERNWLELTLLGDGGLQAVLHAERSGELPLLR